MIGADIKIDKKKKKTELEKAAEKVAEAQESSISKSLKKVYKKFPHLKPKKTDTIDGEKIEGLQSSSKIDVGEKKDYGKTEDWVLARLFKKAGCVMDTAVDQAAIKQGTGKRYAFSMRSKYYFYFFRLQKNRRRSPKSS